MKSNKIFLNLILIILIGMMNFGCSNNYGWNIEKLHINDVWSITNGAGQTIAIIDSGISPKISKDYSDKIVYPYNVINDNADVTDYNGHGTEMASVICCTGERGVWGISPQANIMPICVMDINGKITPENLSKGIYWAINHDATIINLSLGKPFEDQNVIEAIRAAINNNIYVVAAAGDYGNQSLLFPASMQDVISVVAQNQDGTILENSNYSDKATVFAPGNQIPVLSIAPDSNLTNKYTNGSSVATAEVSGIIALLLSMDNKITQKDLIDKLKKSSNENKIINVKELLGSE